MWLPVGQHSRLLHQNAVAQAAAQGTSTTELFTHLHKGVHPHKGLGEVDANGASRAAHCAQDGHRVAPPPDPVEDVQGLQGAVLGAVVQQVVRDGPGAAQGLNEAVSCGCAGSRQSGAPCSCVMLAFETA
jgi:hypothetical protein